MKQKILANFKCQNCGACCRYPGYVYANPSEIAAIAQYLKINIIDFYRQYVKKDDNQLLLSSPNFNPGCFLGSDNKCQIYPVRPKFCQTYPDWDIIWQDEVRLKQEADVCVSLKQLLSTIS